MANQGKSNTGSTVDRNKQDAQNTPANQRQQGNPKQGNPGDCGSEPTRAAQGGKKDQSMKEETEKSRGDA